MQAMMGSTCGSRAPYGRSTSLGSTSPGETSSSAFGETGRNFFTQHCATGREHISSVVP